MVQEVGSVASPDCTCQSVLEEDTEPQVAPGKPCMAALCDPINPKQLINSINSLIKA